MRAQEVTFSRMLSGQAGLAHLAMGSQVAQLLLERCIAGLPAVVKVFRLLLAWAEVVELAYRMEAVAAAVVHRQMVITLAQAVLAGPGFAL